MAGREQEMPLAPGAPASASPDSLYLRHRKGCILCGASTGLVLVAIVTLALTVFRVKNPRVTLSDVTIQGLELSSTGGLLLRTDVNVTLGARVSVKNPNAASMRFTEFTTAISYGGETVGEAPVPAGEARARRTLGFNVTVVLMVDRLARAPGLLGDLSGDGKLEMGSYMVVKGRVRALGIVKKHVVVRMNCTMSVDALTEAVQIQRCSRHVSL